MLGTALRHKQTNSMQCKMVRIVSLLDKHYQTTGTFSRPTFRWATERACRLPLRLLGF